MPMDLIEVMESPTMCEEQCFRLEKLRWTLKFRGLHPFQWRAENGKGTLIHKSALGGGAMD